VEKALRDARLTQIYEGTNQINRLGIIEDMWDFEIMKGLA
jgi:alkylation response protein AidB-like acyl-CoA dehydrogenase